MKTISFIIPVYNCKYYLPDCVASIRAAGVRDYEILLIDDGSTDGSAGVCDGVYPARSEHRAARKPLNLDTPGGVEKIFYFHKMDRGNKWI